MSTLLVQIQLHVHNHLLHQVGKVVLATTANLVQRVHLLAQQTLYSLHQVDKAAQAITANKDACA